MGRRPLSVMEEKKQNQKKTEDQKKTENQNQNTNQKYLIYFLVIAVVALGLYAIFSNGNDAETATEDVTVEVQEQPRAAVVPQENITFCIRLNGRDNMHLPDLLGSPGDDVVDNGIGGYNWSLPPKSTGDEDYGVLPDGTIFVKKEFLSKWNPHKVEIITDATGWRPEETDKGEVGGDPAHTFN